MARVGIVIPLDCAATNFLINLLRYFIPTRVLSLYNSSCFPFAPSPLSGSLVGSGTWLALLLVLLVLGRARGGFF